MIEDCPSKTALRVGLRRAAHQLLDTPLIFDDPLALSILSLDPASSLQSSPGWLQDTPLARVLRGSLAARSRFAEDALHAAIRRGTDQYVILGAGLDTFAYRNSYPPDLLRIVEVDHPATQSWKRACLAEAGIPVPENLIYAAADFEHHSLEQILCQAGVDTGRSIFFAWLGVTPYLSEASITATLRSVAAMPEKSAVVFDYLIPVENLSPVARKAFDLLAEQVALAGEPFQSFFEPAALAVRLSELGFSQIEDVTPEMMNARYFQGRTDGLRVGSLAHLMLARV